MPGPRTAQALTPQLIPHLYGQHKENGQPIGRGKYMQVQATANAEVAIEHDLDRIPQIMPELIDWTGFQPRMARGATSWTNTTVYLQFDTSGTFWAWVR